MHSRRTQNLRRLKTRIRRHETQKRVRSLSKRRRFNRHKRALHARCSAVPKDHSKKSPNPRAPKQCTRARDGTVFDLPRRFSRADCQRFIRASNKVNAKAMGFTQKSSCSPWIPATKPSTEEAKARVKSWRDIHNLSLFVYSAFCCGATAASLYADGQLFDWHALLCTPVEGTWVRFLSATFTFSKLVEWIDTAFLVWLGSSPPLFLHKYHHATTFWLFCIVMNMPGRLFFQHQQQSSWHIEPSSL